MLIYIFTHTQKLLRNTRQYHFQWHWFQSVTFTVTFSAFETSLNCYKSERFLVTLCKEQCRQQTHQTFTISIIFPNGFSEDHSKEGTLTRRLPATSTTSTLPFPDSPQAFLFTGRSLYPLETPQNNPAWHNTQGVVALHSALHLQAKYYHTQVNQKPSGAVANHKIPMCGSFQNWASNVFLHFYKSEESMV